MPTITEVGNPSNSYSFPDFDSWDEFIPYVALDSVTFPESDAKVKEEDKYKLLPDEDDRVTLSEHIDKGFQNHGVEVLTTRQQKVKLTFSVTKASEDSYDPNGTIGAKLSIDDPNIQITSPEKMPITTQYQKTITIELEMTSEERKEFYIDFYSNDNEELFLKGDYKDLYCGRIKIVFEVPNEWEFSEEKIVLAKAYAVKNKANSSNAIRYEDYHHCTDTHKHITLILLDNPTELNLGKDQTDGKQTPDEFEAVGESSTRSVRNSLINSCYAESSTIFTVKDSKGKEVLYLGEPGNTNDALSGFTKSPSQYMIDKAPSNGYYVFIGAVNADYHSFTLILHKTDKGNTFTFIDQNYIDQKSTEQIEKVLLEFIHGYRGNFPMKLELYQLRNSKIGNV